MRRAQGIATVAQERDLSRERIIAAADDALRRFGPAKITVVDVARALNVSHGSVYRHFASKAALLDAVIDVWLGELTAELRRVADRPGPAPKTLRAWLSALRRLETARHDGEAEMFSTYQQLALIPTGVVQDHYAELTAQLSRIVERGVQERAFRSVETEATARSILDATLRFHHPSHASDWKPGALDMAFDNVLGLILNGLSGPE